MRAHPIRESSLLHLFILPRLLLTPVLLLARPHSAQLLQNIIASGLLSSLDPQYPPHGAKLLADEMSAGISASEARDQVRAAHS